MHKKSIPTIFEKSNDCPLNRHRLPKKSIFNIDMSEIIPEKYIEPKQDYSCSDNLILPEVSEVELTRHYIDLSNRNYGVDSGIYPLGSCT
ncbi:MAG: aminomethyl-transferring glycine dehydrogenase subunit GcvPB, partial [Candidatus Lokiarchaeota archaeon]|nr:aminomethyl-transferring glycine dehydrogenase subunit GcvPB [Candidatus Lokiarchaeota archaeon]